jgi:alpha-tubulin suppressor-like RCC1 family protein
LFFSGMLILLSGVRTPAAPGTVVEWGLSNGVSPFNTGISQIAAGRLHLLTLTEAGLQSGWGSNSQGELNIEGNPFGGTLVDIAAGDERSAGVWSTGHVTWSGGGFHFNNWTTATAIAMSGIQTVVRFSDGTVGVDGGTAPPPGLTNVTAVAAGQNHALALKSDGTVVAWGQNLHGQATVPVGLSGVIAIAAGENHSLALRNNGIVVAWGAGTTTDGGSPHLGQSVVPAGLSDVAAIAAGAGHSVALKSDGTVVCWGDNASGQCTVPATVRNVQQIAAGTFFTAAIMLPEPNIVMGEDNRIIPENFRHDFLTTPGGTVSRTFIIANHGTGPLTGLAVSKDGPDAAKFTVSALPLTTLGMGASTTVTVTFQPDTARAYHAELHVASNDPDQSSFGYVLSGRTPMGAVTWGGGRADYYLDRIPVAAADIVAVNSRGTYSAMVRADGSVVAWGGDSENNPAVWTMTPPAGVHVSDVGISDWQLTTVLLTREGAVHTWVPHGAALGAQVLPASAACRRIAAGSLHFLVIKGDGTLHADGENSDGQVTIPPGLYNVQDIAAGGRHSVALRQDGSVAAWGKNDAGQTTVPPGLRAADIAAGNSFTLALLPDGTVTAWGSGPAVPAGLTDVIAINAGGESATAIKRDGSVVVFGATLPAMTLPRAAAITAGGQMIVMTAPVAEIGITQAGVDLVDGLAFDFGWSPVGVAVAKTFTITNAGGAAATLTNTKTGANPGDYIVTGLPASLAAGASSNFTITFTPAAAGPRLVTLQIGSSDPDENPFDIPLCGRTPMNVSAWGFDLAGSTRVPQGLNNAIAVAAGGSHSLALRSNGTVVAWGSDEFGQATVPAGLTGVTAIAAGQAHSLALRSNGTVVHWGNNPQSLPAGLTGVKAIAAGAGHSLALKNDNSLAAWGSELNNEVTHTSGIPDVYSFDAGSYFSLVLRRDETIGLATFSAGVNAQGQLNIPPTGNGLAVTAGHEHGAVLLRDGTVRAWGRNQFGQATVPPGLNSVRAVDAGKDYTLALKNDGSLTAWGLVNVGTPTAPAGYGAVGGISAGSIHVLALTRPFPAITVLMDGRRMQSNAGITFGSAGLAGSEPRTLTIINDGAATLTGLAVSLGFTHAADFTVTQPAVTSLAPGASTTFTARLTPGSAGSKQATLNLASNDPDENPVSLTLTGNTTYTPIQAWRQTWFGNWQNVTPQDNLGDYDADSVPNMLEFAFGATPILPAAAAAPLRYTGPTAGGGTLTARGQPAILYEKIGAAPATIRGLWIRRKDHTAAGLIYTPEFAARPNLWTPSATAPQVIAGDAFYDVVAVTFPATVTGGVPRFFRVRVSIPNPDLPP